MNSSQTFGQNEFFDNKQIIKRIVLNNEGPVPQDPPKINWKKVIVIITPNADTTKIREKRINANQHSFPSSLAPTQLQTTVLN
jgi:hypothetical protein